MSKTTDKVINTYQNSQPFGWFPAPATCSLSSEKYFFDLNTQRRDFSFPVFVNHTNEKRYTLNLFRTFFNSYYPQEANTNQLIRILDIGTGNGDLSSQFIKLLLESYKNIEYYGIDQSNKFISQLEEKLQELPLRRLDLTLGNCFKEGTYDFIERADFTLASQVMTYSANIDSFLKLVLNKTNKTIFLISQSNNSFLNEINIKYALNYKTNNVEEKVDLYLLSLGKRWAHKKVYYPAEIDFPQQAHKSIYEIAYDPYENLKGQDKIIRALLEFISGGVLEYLKQENMLEEFSRDIERHLLQNNGKIVFWNCGYIITRISGHSIEDLQLNKKISARKLTKFSQTLYEKQSDGIPLFFDKAVTDGRLEIARSTSPAIISQILEEQDNKRLVNQHFKLDDYLRYSLIYHKLDKIQKFTEIASRSSSQSLPLLMNNCANQFIKHENSLS